MSFMSKEHYLLEEASQITGIPVNTLRTRLNRGELTGLKVSKGKRLVWALPAFTVNDLQSNVPKSSPYQAVFEKWQNEQRNGYRRKASLSENTIDRNAYGVKAFWKHLEKEPDIQEITVENVMLAIAKVPRDKIPTKDNIYMSMLSFYRSLVWQGLRSELDLLRFKEFKPAKNKRPRRTHLKTEEAFQDLLETNHVWYNGRSKYDRDLTDILLRFLYHTGLRNGEICNLAIRDVDFKERIIYVEKGKGDKDRRLGLDPVLVDPLKKYLECRPRSAYKNFFLQENGNPLNRRVVSERVKDIAEKCGQDLTPHGLRRTFITNLLKSGAPSVLVQKIVGHEHLTTTELYDMSTSDEALDLLRKRAEPLKPMPHTTEKRSLYFEF